MIEGITKLPEEAAQLSPEEMRGVAAKFIAGIDGLFERFEQQENSKVLDLEAIVDNEPVVAVVACGSEQISVIAGNDQIHTYGLAADENGNQTLMRADSVAPNESEPYSQAPSTGTNRQPVDSQELEGLFNLLKNAKQTGLQV